MNDLSQKLKSVLSDAHYDTVESLTNKSKEKEYVKKLIRGFLTFSGGKKGEHSPEMG